MNTPCFVISKQLLDNNINDFKNALKEVWPNSKLAYSVKTNSLPWLLKYLKDTGLVAEVVSDEEYELSKKCGFIDEAIVFNGPIKGEELFYESLKNGAYINLDSKNDLKYLEKASIRGNERVGIRINLDPAIFNQEDIGYEEDGFRFGFSDEAGELEPVIKLIRDVKGIKNLGLHLHCNSVTRSVNVYMAVAKYAANIINKYQLELDFIDMGGGFFGGVPGKTTANEYVTAIKNEFEKVVDLRKTTLIIEPGSAIIGSVVDYVTKVVDVKDTIKSRIVTTDGSRINIDPLWIKKSYMHSVDSTEKRPAHPKQIICGYTCMDHDRIMTIADEPELEIGDKITYYRVGAYSMTFGGMFIRYYPDVYVKDNDNIIQVRQRTNVDEYYNIHTIN